MSDDKKNQPDTGEGAVYRVETVPPPAGEDDAYSAPTRVGPLGDAFVQGLMKDADQRNVELGRKKQSQETAPKSKRPAVDETPPSSKVPVSAGGTPLPRIYDEETDEEDKEAATRLGPMAKPPAEPHRPTTLKVASSATTAPSPADTPVPPPPVDVLAQYASDRAPASSPEPLPSLTPESREPIPFEPLSPESEEPGRTNPRTIALFALLVVLVMIAVLLFTKQH